MLLELVVSFMHLTSNRSWVRTNQNVCIWFYIYIFPYTQPGAYVLPPSGKVSAQPHTIVKQICFPNGNVLFLSLFSLFKNWMHNVVWGCAEILPTQLTCFWLSKIPLSWPIGDSLVHLEYIEKGSNKSHTAFCSKH